MCNACKDRSALSAFSTSWNCQLKLCMICTTVLHTRMIVPAFTIYAFPRSSIEPHALFKLGNLYSGSSIIKKDFLYFCPVIFFTSKAPSKTKRIPTRYIVAETHHASAKNAPAKRAITGILRSTWHKWCKHRCGTTFSFVTDCTASHTPGIAHSRTNDHRND